MEWRPPRKPFRAKRRAPGKREQTGPAAASRTPSTSGRFLSGTSREAFRSRGFIPLNQSETVWFDPMIKEVDEDHIEVDRVFEARGGTRSETGKKAYTRDELATRAPYLGLHFIPASLVSRMTKNELLKLFRQVINRIETEKQQARRAGRTKRGRGGQFVSGMEYFEREKIERRVDPKVLYCQCLIEKLAEHVAQRRRAGGSRFGVTLNSAGVMKIIQECKSDFPHLSAEFDRIDCADHIDLNLLDRNELIAFAIAKGYDVPGGVDTVADLRRYLRARMQQQQPHAQPQPQPPPPPQRAPSRPIVTVMEEESESEEEDAPIRGPPPHIMQQQAYNAARQQYMQQLQAYEAKQQHMAEFQRQQMELQRLEHMQRQMHEERQRLAAEREEMKQHQARLEQATSQQIRQLIEQFEESKKRPKTVVRPEAAAAAQERRVVVAPVQKGSIEEKIVFLMQSVVDKKMTEQMFENILKYVYLYAALAGHLSTIRWLMQQKLIPPRQWFVAMATVTKSDRLLEYFIGIAKERRTKDVNKKVLTFSKEEVQIIALFAQLFHRDNIVEIIQEQYRGVKLIVATNVDASMRRKFDVYGKTKKLIPTAYFLYEAIGEKNNAFLKDVLEYDISREEMIQVLHLAAITGNVEILNEIKTKFPNNFEKNLKSGSIVLLAAMYNQRAAFEMMESSIATQYRTNMLRYVERHGLPAP